jgi:hypothetical protein
MVWLGILSLLSCKKNSFYDSLPFETTEFSGRLKQPEGPPQNELFFLVDFSGSMKDVDPTEKQTCRRFLIAKDILNQLKAEKKTLHISDIGFSYSEDLLLGKYTLSEAISNLTSEYFCRYIEGTDYGLAFQNAYQFLQSSEKKKFVILLSDGLPDTRDQNKREGKNPDPDNKIARKKGLDAADKLKSLKQAEIIVLFFNESKKSEISPEIFNYLSKVTGKSKNILSVFDQNFPTKLKETLQTF